MAKKRKGFFKTAMACLGGVAVLAGITFSLMWFVPSIHDKIWQPGDNQQTEQEQNTNTETNNTNKE